jgi:hypothetical protein
VDDPHRRNGLEPTAFRPRKYAFQKQALLRRNHLPQKNNDYSLTKRILSVPKCIVLKEFNFRGRSLHPAYLFLIKDMVRPLQFLSGVSLCSGWLLLGRR